MNNQFAVIMAGGKGERFWPMSRLDRPKHLLPIIGEDPLIKETVDRLEGLVPKKNIFIITNAVQRAGIEAACPELNPEQIVAEPVGRDTAAAVALGAYLVRERDPDGVFAILPADHVIHDSQGFRKSIKAAFEAATANSVLVTIGIPPTSPATGYGYIHKGEATEGYYKVQNFKEKPDAATAQSYIDSGEYFWNAGMFTWGVKTIFTALEAHTPELAKAINGLKTQSLDEVYPALEKISVDYAIMEKADNVVTLPATFDWDDAGEWTALERHLPQDEFGNTIQGSAVIESGSDNIVVSKDGHMTALVGVKDLVVVHTEDATLVCHKDSVQDIKGVVQRLDNKALV